MAKLLFVCFLLVGAAFASPHWLVKSTMQKLEQRMQRRALQQSDMELQAAACSDADITQIGNGFIAYQASCPNDPNTRNATCDITYTTAEFCGTTCPQMQSDIFTLVLNLGCLDLLYTPCSKSSQCSNGDACYLGYCQASCATDSDCNMPCDPAANNFCAVASTTGSVKVCQDPLILTKADYAAQLNWQVNYIVTKSVCLDNGNGVWCYDIPAQYPTGNVSCAEAVPLGCCSGFLYRSFAVCTKTTATDNLNNLHASCTQVNWNATCTNELPLCPATGGPDNLGPGSGSAAMAMQPFGLMVLALSFAMLFR